MHDQPRTKPYKANSAFTDGTSARLPPSGTVARDVDLDDSLLIYGSEGGKAATTYPFPVTLAVLRRGEERFHIYCEPCHGMLGEGDGPVARRGFFPKPVADLQQLRLRDAAAGYLFAVITNGFSTMPAYGSELPPADRWATVAYLRALQLSQHQAPGDLPEGEPRTPDKRSKAP